MAWFAVCESESPDQGGIASLAKSHRMPRAGVNGIGAVFGPYSSVRQAQQIVDDWNEAAWSYIDDNAIPAVLRPFGWLADWFYSRAENYVSKFIDESGEY